MIFWVLHALIPLLVLLFMSGGPVWPMNLVLIIIPVLLAFLMGALIWLEHWVTAIPTLAGSVLLSIALLVWIPNALDSVRERREELNNTNARDSQ